MLHWFSSRGIAVPIALAIIVLGVVQITLQVWAVVDVIKRSAPTQRKAVFAAVIVLAGLIGAIAYFAVGRSMLEQEARDARTGGEGGVPNEDARRRALDHLYGPDQRR